MAIWLVDQLVGGEEKKKFKVVASQSRKHAPDQQEGEK